MKKIPHSIIAVNAFGATGYLLLVATWVFFVTILIATPIEVLAEINPVDTPQKSSAVAPAASFAIAAASYVITAVVVVVSIGILITLPYFAGKWGSHLLRRLMRLLKIPMARRQLFLVKSIVATLPLMGLLIVYSIVVPESTTFGAMYIATLVLSVLSIVSFLVQTAVARRLGISAEKTW